MEKKFLYFINKNKYLIILFLLIPQLFILTYFYYIEGNSKNCSYQAKIQVNLIDKPSVDNFIQEIIKQLPKKEMIEYSELRYPYVYFEGKNFECEDKINKAKNNINLLSKKFILNFNEFTTSFNQNNKNLLGVDSNFFEFFSSVTKNNFLIIEITDIKQIKTYLKKQFIVSVGLLIFSISLIFLIFFFKIYLNKK